MHRLNIVKDSDNGLIHMYHGNSASAGRVYVDGQGELEAILCLIDKKWQKEKFDELILLSDPRQMMNISQSYEALDRKYLNYIVDMHSHRDGKPGYNLKLDGAPANGASR